MRVTLVVLAILGAIGGGTAFGGGFVEPSLATTLLMIVGGLVCVLASLVAAGLGASAFGPAAVRRTFAIVGAVGAVCGVVGAARAEFSGPVAVVLTVVATVALLGYAALCARVGRTPSALTPASRQPGPHG